MTNEKEEIFSKGFAVYIDKYDHTWAIPYRNHVFVFFECPECGEKAMIDHITDTLED